MTETNKSPTRRTWLKFQIACAINLVAMLSPLPIAGQAIAQKTQVEHVRLIVDFNDGAEKHFKKVPWRAGMTVLDAMQYLAKHPHGITFEYQGKGATALLTSIDDVRNSGSDGRNWIYRVNGKHGNRSFGIFKLNKNDTVLWKFDTYR